MQSEWIDRQKLEVKVKAIYEKYFSSVRQYILNNSGDLDDAKDIFQDLSLIYLKQIKGESHIEILNEKNYIFGIAKNLWLKKLKEKKLFTSIENAKIVDRDPVYENEFELSAKDSLLDIIAKKLEEISEECKQIIYAAFYLKKSAIEIAKITGYSEQFIKVKKYRCMQGLRKMLADSTDLQQT